jgi:hypothetical protein
MKITLLYKVRHPYSWSAFEPWTVRTCDFLSRYNGKIFRDMSVGQPFIIYADIHPDQHIINTWFLDGTYQYGGIKIVCRDNVPSGLDQNTIFKWITEAGKN